MKLLLCKKCSDVIKLDTEPRKCKCGLSGGRYLEDSPHAEFWGDYAVPIGFANSSLVEALRNPPIPYASRGKVFEAFVIADEGCPTFTRVEPPKDQERNV